MTEADQSGTDPLIHVVLHEPEIPQNTGNIGRTCVAIGAKLWLIRPLGFLIDDKHLRRAGMDYWQYLDWTAVDRWEDVLDQVPHGRLWCFTKKADRVIWDASFAPGDLLVFGSESRGLPDSILEKYADSTLGLPMRSSVRSLNLASTVNTACYEAVRQFGGLPPVL